jgi:hypothetical protein
MAVKWRRRRQQSQLCCHPGRTFRQYGLQAQLPISKLEDVAESPISSLPQTLWPIGSGIATEIDFE